MNFTYINFCNFENVFFTCYFQPKPYSFTYGVKDDYSGNDFSRMEERGDHGVTKGSYKVALPDGRIQVGRLSLTNISSQYKIYGLCKKKPLRLIISKL